RARWSRCCRSSTGRTARTASSAPRTTIRTATALPTSEPWDYIGRRRHCGASRSAREKIELMTSLTTIFSTMTAAFLASFVEMVEAFTIVLAVGITQSWRPAIVGTMAALAVLAALVILLGPLLGMIPIHAMQYVIGVLLILFGMRWLRKAVLRSIG